MKDWTQFIAELAGKKLTDAVDDAVFRWPSPSNATVAKQVSSQIQKMGEDDLKNRGYDSLLRQGGTKEALTRATGRLSLDIGKIETSLPDIAEEYHKEYLERNPEPIDYTPDNVRDYYGGFYTKLLERQIVSDDPLQRERFRDDFFNRNKIPYFTVFGQEKKEAVLERQRAYAQDMGSFKISPYFTRSDTGKLLFKLGTQRVLDNISPEDVGTPEGLQRYSEIAEYMSRQHFDHGMSHDVFYNWVTGEDQYARLFQADPEFSWTDHQDKFNELTENLNDEMTQRIAESKSMAEALAVYESFSNNEAFERAFGNYFGEGFGGAAGRLAMGAGIGFADPLGLATGAVTGGLGSLGGRALLGKEGIKALFGRALIDGTIGGAEAALYAHAFAKESDPLRNEADLTTAMLLGTGLGATFELMAGEVASTAAAKQFAKVKERFNRQARVANQADNALQLARQAQDNGRAIADPNATDNQLTNVQRQQQLGPVTDLKDADVFVGRDGQMLVTRRTEGVGPEPEDKPSTRGIGVRRDTQSFVDPDEQDIVDNSIAAGILDEDNNTVMTTEADAAIQLIRDENFTFPELEAITDATSRIQGSKSNVRAAFETEIRKKGNENLSFVNRLMYKVFNLIGDFDDSSDIQAVFRVLALANDESLTREKKLAGAVFEFGLSKEIMKLIGEGQIESLTIKNLIQFFLENQFVNKDIPIPRVVKLPISDLSMMDADGVIKPLSDALKIVKKGRSIGRGASKKGTVRAQEAESLAAMEGYGDIHRLVTAIENDMDASPIALRVIELIEQDENLSVEDALSQALKDYEKELDVTIGSDKSIIKKFFDGPSNLQYAFYEFESSPALQAILDKVPVSEVLGGIKENFRTNKPLAIFAARLKALEAGYFSGKINLTLDEFREIMRLSDSINTEVATGQFRMYQLALDRKGRNLTKKIWSRRRLTPDDLQMLADADLSDYHIEVLRDLAGQTLNFPLDYYFMARPDYNKPVITKPRDLTIQALQRYVTWYRSQPDSLKRFKLALAQFSNIRNRVAYMKRIRKNVEGLLKRQTHYEGELARIEVRLDQGRQFALQTRPLSPDAEKVLRKRQTLYRSLLQTTKESLDELSMKTGVVFSDFNARMAYFAEIGATENFLAAARASVDLAARIPRTDQLGPGNTSGRVSVDLLLGPLHLLVKGMDYIFKNVTKLDPRLLSPEYRQRKAQIREGILRSVATELSQTLNTNAAKFKPLKSYAEEIATKYKLPKKEVYKTLTKLWSNRVGGKGKMPAMWDSFHPLDDPFNPLLDRHSLFSVGALRNTLKDFDEFLNGLSDSFKELVDGEYFEFDYDKASLPQLMDRMSTIFEVMDRVEELDVTRSLQNRNLKELDRVYRALGIDATNETRFNLFRYRARLAGMTGNIFAPDTFKDLVSTKISNRLNYIPLDVILRDLPGFDDFDFALYHKTLYQNYFPYASDFALGGLGNITYGYIANQLAKSRLGTFPLRTMLEQFAHIVVTPHRTVLVELEKIGQELQQLSLTRKPEEVDIEAILGPIGPTGLPSRIEKLLLPSSQQDGWRRWIASVEEVLAQVGSNSPKQRARFFKRKHDTIKYLLDNKDEFSIDDTQANILNNELIYYKTEYNRMRNLVKNPLIKDVFKEVDDLIKGYAKFFDDNVKDWADTYDLNTSKSVIEHQIKQLTDRLDRLVRGLKAETPDPLTKDLYDDAISKLEKTVNQVHLLGGLDEPYPQSSVDVVRLDILRSIPFADGVPTALQQQVKYKLSQLLSKIKAEYHHKAYPDWLKEEFTQVETFLQRLKDAASEFETNTLYLKDKTNAELRAEFDNAKGNLVRIRELFDDKVGTELADLPEQAQKAVREGLEEFVENAEALIQQAEFAAFGKPKKRVLFDTFDVRITEDEKLTLAIKEAQKQVSNVDSLDTLKKWLVTKDALSTQIQVVAAFAKRALELGDFDVAGLQRFLKEIATEGSERLNDNLYDFLDNHLDVFSMETLEERLNRLMETPDDDIGPPPGLEPMYAGVSLEALQDLWKAFSKYVKGLGSDIAKRLHHFGSDLKVITRGSFNNERLTGKGLNTYYAKPGGVFVKNLAEWILHIGADRPFTAFGRVVPELNFLRSARSRAGANELGVIRMLGRMIFGSELFEVENNKLYNAGDNHAKSNSLTFGIARYRARLLGGLLAKINRLRKQQVYLQKTLGVSELRFEELLGVMYEGTLLYRQQAIIRGLKEGETIPTMKELFKEVESSVNSAIEMVDLLQQQGIEVPEEFSFNTTKGYNNLVEVMRFMTEIDKVKRSLGRSLPSDHVLREVLDSGKNLVMISNDSVKDLDRILVTGELEKALSDSIQLTNIMDAPVSQEMKDVLAYIILAEIRSGNLTIFGQINLLDGLRGFGRSQMKTLLKRHLDDSRLREIFPKFAEGKYAPLSEDKLVHELLNEMFPAPSMGIDINTIKQNARRFFVDQMKSLLPYRSSDDFALEYLLKKGYLDQEDSVIFRKWKERGKDWLSPEARGRLERRVLPAISGQKGKFNKLVPGLKRDLLEYVQKSFEEFKELYVQGPKGGEIGFRYTANTFGKLSKKYKFKLVYDAKNNLDYDATVKNLLESIQDFDTYKDFDSFMDDALNDIYYDKFSRKKNFTSQELQEVTIKEDEFQKIKIKVDVDKTHTSKINTALVKNEEYKRVKNRTRLGQKIDSGDTTIQEYTLADLAAAYSLQDLEYQGRRIIDQSMEADFLQEINSRIGFAGLKDRFDTADEFFDYILSQFDNAVKEGKLTNVREAVRMLEYMRSILTGKVRNNYRREVGDFIRLMQKGANAASVAGFGIPAMVELSVVTARNFKRLFSNIPVISQVLDGSQKIMNFEPEIKKRKKRIETLVSRKRKNLRELQEIEKLQNELVELEEKQSFTLDVIYGAGVGTEGAMFRNTGSTRRSLVFDEKNPVTTAAAKPEQIGRKPFGRRAVDAVEGYLDNAIQSGSEGNLFPLIPFTDKLPKAGKYLSLNFITEKSQEIVFNSFITKLIRKIERLDLDTSIEEGTWMNMKRQVRIDILKDVLPEIIQNQLGLSTDGFFRFVYGTKKALKDHPPVSKNGFTYYDLGSLFHHKAITSSQRHIVLQAAYNWVGQNVVRPDAGDLPLFMSSPFLQLIGQFRSFGVAQFQKMVVPLLQRAVHPQGGPLLSKTRAGATAAFVTTALMSTAYAFLQYAIYNPEKVQEDLKREEGQGETLTPTGRLIAGSLLGLLGMADFGSDLAYSMTGVQDPTSWYENDFQNRDQTAIDLANGMASYRFFRDLVQKPVSQAVDLASGLADESIRENMEMAYDLGEGNAYQKTRDATAFAGLKPKEVDRTLQRMTGNYRLMKIIEALLTVMED